MSDTFIETGAAEDLFTREDLFARAAQRSPEFWAAMIALGGTPEQVAPHLPEMTEGEVANKLADAIGKAFDAEPVRAPQRSHDSPQRSREKVPGGPGGTHSNWGARIGARGR